VFLQWIMRSTPSRPAPHKNLRIQTGLSEKYPILSGSLPLIAGLVGQFSTTGAP